MDIKPIELRIGSIVRSKKFNQAVTLELADFAEADKHADHSNSLEWFERLEPEPINEKWLKILGFERIQEGYYEYWVKKYWNKIKTIEKKLQLTLDYFPPSDGDPGYHMAIWLEGNTNVHIYSVHVLQNLWLVLTGEKLKIPTARTSPHPPLSSD